MSEETSVVIRPDSTSALALAQPMSGIEPPPVELTEKQAEVVKLITKGVSFTRAAKLAKVDRSTVYRWRTIDPNFIAALNRWREEVQTQVGNHLTALTEEAARSLRKVVRRNEGRVELKILEKMHCLEPGKTYPIDPYHVFGNGIDDVTGRWRMAVGMKRAAASMNPDQSRRAPQLLALGVAFENARAGQSSPPDLLEMAGPLANELQRAATAGDAVPAIAASSDEGRPAGDSPAPMKVKAYVVRHSARIGSSGQTLPFVRRR